MLFFLCRYENADIALNCGMMLRECIRVQELAEIILKSSELYKFFDYVQKSTFDIASDAFATFKVRPFTFGDTSNYFLVFRIY
jgi:calcium binding protein 39